MKYSIVITKIEEKTVTKHGEYNTIDERPWTNEDFNKDKSAYQKPEVFLAANPLKRIFGYAPSWEGVEIEETQLLKQTVDELDLTAVIKAINGL